MPQNSYFCAKQNAKRLHGGPNLGLWSMDSPSRRSGIQYQCHQRKTSRRSKIRQISPSKYKLRCAQPCAQFQQPIRPRIHFLATWVSSPVTASPRSSDSEPTKWHAIRFTVLKLGHKFRTCTVRLSRLSSVIGSTLARFRPLLHSQPPPTLLIRVWRLASPICRLLRLVSRNTSSEVSYLSSRVLALMRSLMERIRHWAQ